MRQNGPAAVALAARVPSSDLCWMVGRAFGGNSPAARNKVVCGCISPLPAQVAQVATATKSNVSNLHGAVGSIDRSGGPAGREARTCRRGETLCDWLRPTLAKDKAAVRRGTRPEWMTGAALAAGVGWEGRSWLGLSPRLADNLCLTKERTLKPSVYVRAYYTLLVGLALLRRLYSSNGARQMQKIHHVFCILLAIYIERSHPQIRTTYYVHFWPHAAGTS